MKMLLLLVGNKNNTGLYEKKTPTDFRKLVFSVTPFHRVRFAGCYLANNYSHFILRTRARAFEYVNQE